MRGNTAKQHGSMRNMEPARLAGLAMLAMARAIRALSVALSAQTAPRSRPITAAMSGIPRARLLEAQLTPGVAGMIAACLPLYRPRAFDCLGRFSDDVLIQACGCPFARSLPSAEACRNIIADTIYNAGSGMVFGVNFVAACAIKWLQSVGIRAPTARVALLSVMAPPVTCTQLRGGQSPKAPKAQIGAPTSQK